MASRNLIFLCIFQLLLVFILHFACHAHASAQSSSLINPFMCTPRIKSCTSLLYQHNKLSEEQISTLYSVDKSAINSISISGRKDYLISVPCSCQYVDTTIGYFYDTVYKVKPNDTFFDVSNWLYSGSVWKVGGEEKSYIPGVDVTMHLLCGCLGTDLETVVTYTVQKGDSLSTIAKLFSASVRRILEMNPYLGSGSKLLFVGSLLYVPMNLPPQDS